MGSRYKSKNKSSILKKIIMAIILIIAVIIYRNYTISESAPFKVSEEISIEVSEDANLSSILEQLEEDNHLKNFLFTKIYLKLNEKDINTKVIPGNYSISEDMSLLSFIKNVNEGNFNDTYVDITIPEGYTVEDIAEVLEENEITSKKAFLKAVKSYDLPNFIKHNDKKGYDLEGYLFPNTYKFKVGEDPDKIIEELLKTFEDIIKKIEDKSGEDIQIDKLDEIITKASMIEKETRVDSERELVASVIDNRLKTGMQLKIDATVIYAHIIAGDMTDKEISKLKELVTFKALEIDSPYNTYKIEGIPVGAICNPGEKSIKAALSPASTDYLFYVLEDGENHYFTNSDVDFMNKLKELGY